MIIQPYSLPQFKVPGVNLSLYAHQVAMVHLWKQYSSFLLVTRTGSGKTAASVLPVVKNRESAVLIYPTNELIRDQEQSIAELLIREGVSHRVMTPETIRNKYKDEDVIIIHIDAARLEEYRRKMNKRTKGEVLLSLLHPDKPKLILTNPDILYLIYSLKYSKAPEVIQTLKAYKTVVFDEFHLYRALELAHILFLIYLGKQLGSFSRIILLSATPHPNVQELIDTIISAKIITPNQKTHYGEVVQECTISHQIELFFLPKMNDLVTTIKTKLLQMRDKLVACRQENASDKYVPCVVIVNSVVQAIKLEDLLVESGFKRDEICPIRGLSAKTTRNIVGKLIVVGTSAIEVGIDFQCDYLIFEAGEAASFLQRLGRLGRHGPGRAYLVGDFREEEMFKNLPSEINRSELELFVNTYYPSANAYAWFVRTFSGLITIFAQAEAIVSTVAESARENSDIVIRFQNWIDEKLKEYFNILGVSREFKKVWHCFRLLKKEDPLVNWLSAYVTNLSFRTSMPSVEVYDRSEEARGRQPEYSVDLYTLITRVRGTPRFNDKLGKMIIDGFGDYHQVWIEAVFGKDERGRLKSTKDYPDTIILQDGHLSPLSYYLVKPHAHVFYLFPRELTHKLDWRIPFIRCGKMGDYCLAMDGNALLVKEIFERSY